MDSGAIVHVENEVDEQGAVGSGVGIQNDLKKVSVSPVGGGFQTYDRLRPAEIVTLDLRHADARVDSLLDPRVRWVASDVAWDADNDWRDAAVADAHAYGGFTYDYLFAQQGWRGMNGRDGRILSMVNIGRAGENNAFFVPPPFGPEGTGVVAFGQFEDGTPLTSVDIVAHEVMHGVTHFSVSRRTGGGLLNNVWGYLGPRAFTLGSRTFRCGEPLVYRTGPFANRRFRFACEDDRFVLLANHGGAVNEAFSDIIGTAVEFSVHAPGAGPLRADYVMGEDTGQPRRSLENPRSLTLGNSSIPYPDAYSRLVRFLVGVFEDNGRYFFSTIGSVDGRTIVYLPGADRGGVHWNSTMLSHAFYLAIEGGRNETTGRTVQGVGTANRHQIEQVFFRAMTALMPSRTNFQITDAVIRQSAVDLFGVGSAAQRAVYQALDAVGP